MNIGQHARLANTKHKIINNRKKKYKGIQLRKILILMVSHRGEAGIHSLTTIVVDKSTHGMNHELQYLFSDV